MSWVRIDDGFATHPKIAELSDRAFRAHVEALCYCAQHLTDGKVPGALARSLGKRSVDELTGGGLWEQNGVGYVIHGYLDYNPSREQVEDERRKARERRANAGRNGGVRSGEVRATSARRNEAPSPALRSFGTNTRVRGSAFEDPGPRIPTRYFRGNCPDCHQELHQTGNGPITGHEAGCEKAVAK